MLKQGLAEAVTDIPPCHFELKTGDKIKLVIESLEILSPRVPQGTSCRDSQVFPTECRQRHSTYRGPARAQIGWYINGVKQESFTNHLGDLPIMVKVCFQMILSELALILLFLF